MLKKNQHVTLAKDVMIKARKGRSRITLGYAGDEVRVIGPHENLPGYYYIRATRVDVPPMSILHFTEVTVG